MSIADALRELKDVQYLFPREKRAIKILEDALDDKFSIENMEIIFPNEEEETVTAVVPERTNKKQATGGSYVELKTINGCGPYAYKRWREGGRLKSEYIGKVVGT